VSLKSKFGEQTLKIINNNLLLQIVMPAVGRIIELSYQAKVEVQATIAIIALIRYRQNKGLYPEHLQMLVKKGYLKELPLDPYSVKPLVYRKKDDSFLLYSISSNFTDDGGKNIRHYEGRIEDWPEKGDKIFRPVYNNQTRLVNK